MIAEVVPIRRGAAKLPFFDYEIPVKIIGDVRIGQLVVIELRSKEEFGIIINIKKSISNFKLKPIIKIVSAKPILSVEQINFYLEFSEFYHTSLGLVLKMALPPLKKRKVDKESHNFQEPLPGYKMPKHPTLHTYKNKNDQLEIILKKLDKDAQNLIVMPEVSDANKLHEQLKKIHDSAALLTSSTTDKEMFETWLKINTGEIKIVIGTRNTLLLPFHHLKSVIIDQSNHFGHKSWDSVPRFFSKDAALLASKHLGSELHFITHTPSVEEYSFTSNKIYTGNLDLSIFKTNIEIANILAEKRTGHKEEWGLSAADAISNSQGNVFIYCNRKGTASYVICNDCSQVMICKNCNKPLTFHEKKSNLICHVCKIFEQLSENCKKCGGPNLKMYGLGTAGVAKEVKKIFANDKRPIEIIDKESEVLIKTSEPVILVGTQYAWKSLEWEKIGLMIFFDPDQQLHSPEYLASEELFRQIREACFRLPENSKMIIQTRNPEHPVFSGLIEPKNFYLNQMSERQRFGFPPYKYLTKFIYSANNINTGKAEAEKFYENISKLTISMPNIKISQPVEQNPAFVKGKYQIGLIAKLEYGNYKKQQKMLARLMPEDWKTDPNPINIQ